MQDGDLAEDTDEDADKLIFEIEGKVGGGNEGGVKFYLFFYFCFLSFYFLKNKMVNKPDNNLADFE